MKNMKFVEEKSENNIKNDQKENYNQIDIKKSLFTKFNKPKKRYIIIFILFVLCFVCIFYLYKLLNYSKKDYIL